MAQEVDPLIDALFYISTAFFPFFLTGILIFLLRRKRKNRAHSTGWVLFVNALVFFTGLSGLFLGFETYYRFLYNATDSFALVRTTQHWVARYNQENQFGFRDNVEYSRTQTAGKKRFTFLGDSFTVGDGIKNVEDRFPNLIRRAKPLWEIHVFGTGGFDTAEELRLIRKKATKGYEFEKIVLIYNLNDIMDMVPEWRDVLLEIRATAQSQNFFIRYSYFLNLMYFRYKYARTGSKFTKIYDDLAQSAYSGPVWEKQKERLELLKNTAEQSGGRFRVVIFPYIQSLEPNYQYRFAHEQLGLFWKKLEVPYLDLLSIYKDYRPNQLMVNRYDAHPNEFANRLAAEAIQNFLETS